MLSTLSPLLSYLNYLFRHHGIEIKVHLFDRPIGFMFQLNWKVASFFIDELKGSYLSVS
jgi:hypothetical protein